MRAKLTSEIKDFIDEQIKAQIKSSKGLNYTTLAEAVAQKYRVRLSKSTICKRTRALSLGFRRGRKRLVPVGERPARSIYLDCAGGFFLKGVELEIGLLAALNQQFMPSTESTKAQKALKLAQQINAFLLYAPVFRLETAKEIAAYKDEGLFYLTEQKSIPGKQEIRQYLRYLVDQKLLPPIIKEVAKISTEALLVRVDFAKQAFYLDAQSHTVWAGAKVPRYFSATLNKTISYVKDVFQSPSAQRPLILQTCPGYTDLPPEMFSFIRCLEHVPKEPITQLTIMGKFGENLTSWKDLKTPRKCYFIFSLSPWQYARLQDTQIVKDFRPYVIGPERENMSVADAEVNLFNPQLHKNIRVRAALVRRKQERLALITNISRREERYIRKIAEQYFCRWPDKKVKSFYDVLEAVPDKTSSRSQKPTALSVLLTKGYKGRPEDVFRVFLEHLNHFALARFFPPEYEEEDLKSMREKIYQQNGYLKIKQNSWEIFLLSFGPGALQEACQIACQRFNQMDLKFPNQKRLRIYLQ